jgi:hypothetical protein
MNQLIGIENEKICNIGNKKDTYATIDAIIEILKLNNEIETIKQIYANDDFNLLYKLKNEDVIRGMNIVNVMKQPHTHKYQEYNISLRKYNYNPLIVGYNIIDKIGLIYLYTDDYYVKTCSFSRNGVNKFSKLFLSSEFFTNGLFNSLSKGNIITNDYYINSKINRQQKMNKKMLGTLEKGLTTELFMLDVLKNIDIIKSVKKDHFNSKFDIFFKLSDGIKRGLQVKNLTKIQDCDSFKMANLNKYSEGTLIVGVNQEHKVGLAYLYSEKYNTKHAFFSKNKNSRGKYANLLKDWDEFIIDLTNLLSQATIITPEIYRLSLIDATYREYLSVKRFKLYCKNNNFTVQYKLDTYGNICLLINDFKVNLKFVLNHKLNCHFYETHTTKDCYTQGDYDFYVVEIGLHLGEFFIVHESELIKYGIVSTDTQKGKTAIQIYPYDYQGKIRSKSAWTADKKYWFSTEKGHLERCIIEKTYIAEKKHEQSSDRKRIKK